MINLSNILKTTSLCLFLCSNLLAQDQLTNELIWGKASPFRMKSVDQVRSMNDGEHYSALNRTKEGWSVDKYSFKTYEKTGAILTYQDISVDEKVVLQNYEFNLDETKLLLETNITPIYRRSYTAVYYIHDIKSKKTTPLSEKAVMHAEFSPNGEQVAYVFENNLYLFDIETGDTRQITGDGVMNHIINGATDWVYEEEFAIAKAFEWSPDGKSIAYLTFNESEVKQFNMAMYGGLYPTDYEFKYPKAGEANSHVNAFVHHIRTGITYDLNVTKGEELYIPRINWTNDPSTLCVQTMNRHQNVLNYELFTIDFSGPPQKDNITRKTAYTETSETYIEIDDDLIFTKDGKHFIRTSERNGYNHIYKISFDGDIFQVTTGDWDVIQFMGLSNDGKTMYYLSAEDGAMYQNLYSIGLNGKKKQKLSTRQGKNRAFFSTGMKYYINYHSSANSPYYITLHSADGKELKALETNEELRKTLQSYKLPKKEFIKVQGHAGELNAWIIKPPNFDANKKYPVYLFVYGGPGHNTVSDQYEGSGYLWHCMMAQKGYIVMSVDPRGTMYRGETFKKSTYLQLGKLETEDLIATAKHMKKLPYVDPNRIAVQGWSYGGYMTSLCMTKGAAHFKVGIAVAPVTNWRFYDSIYTERFMRTPKENANGYDDNSPINHVEKLKGKYLLIHGSADDNVHMQNTMEMITALVAANKQFDLFIYPDKNHGIYGGNTRLHLYNKITDFVDSNL